VQLTPGERALLEESARIANASSLSAYVRRLCLRDLAVTTATHARSNAAARELAWQLSAIGNNLNQLARMANTTGALPARSELLATTALLKAALARVIAL
jgi:hypothetical protein